MATPIVRFWNQGRRPYENQYTFYMKNSTAFLYAKINGHNSPTISVWYLET